MCCHLANLKITNNILPDTVVWPLSISIMSVIYRFSWYERPEVVLDLKIQY